MNDAKLLASRIAKVSIKHVVDVFNSAYGDCDPENERNVSELEDKIFKLITKKKKLQRVKISNK